MPADALRSVAWLSVRQAEVFLAQPGEMGREDDAAAVAGPVVHVERRVVRGQVGIAGVAEDALDEVEIRHQPTGHEEPDLHALFRQHLRAPRGRPAGRSSSETMVSTGCGQFAVNGRRMSWAGGRRASCSSRRYATSGTRSLSAGIGRPPSATWNTPWVVRRSLIGLCSTPLSRR